MPAKRIDIEKFCPVCDRKFGAEDDLTDCPADGGLLMPVKSDPLIGTLVAGKFEILNLVGAGGWSVVYGARHTKLDRMVAFKVLRADLASTAERIQRFEREARIISSLSHPHICAVYDYGILDSGQPYLVLEYLTGRTVAEILADSGIMPIETTVSLLKQSANALSAAHTKGIIHRDLKPANLMVVEHQGAQSVKIIDFGLAKTYEALEADQLTHTGLTIGTPTYMSPEQVRGSVLDARSDVYSFGCVMYEMLTGKAAITGRNTFEIMQNHLEYVPKIGDGQKVPQALQDITLDCLSKAADQRYQSMHELEMDLDSFQRRGKIKGRNKQLIKILAKGKGRVTVGTVVLGLVLVGALFAAKVGAPNAVSTAGNDTAASLFDSKLARLDRLSQADQSAEAEKYGDHLIVELKSQGLEYSPQMVRVGQAMSTLLIKHGKKAAVAPYVHLRLAAQQRLLRKGSDEYLDAHQQAMTDLLGTDQRKVGSLPAQVVALTEDKYGPDSKEVCSPLESLAWSQLVYGKFQDSENTFKRLLTLLKKYYSPHDFLYVRTLGNLSWVECNLRQFEKARAYSKQALALVGEGSPRFHQDLLTTSALAEQKCGNFDTAIDYFRQAIVIAQKVDGFEATKISGDLGRCYLEAKRYKEAEPILRQAIQNIDKTWGSESANYRLCLSDYVELLRRTGRSAEADKIEATGKL